MKTPLFVQFLKGKKLYDKFCAAYDLYSEEYAFAMSRTHLPIQDYFLKYAKNDYAINNAFPWSYDDGTVWQEAHLSWARFLMKHKKP